MAGKEEERLLKAEGYDELDIEEDGEEQRQTRRTRSTWTDSKSWSANLNLTWTDIRSYGNDLWTNDKLLIFTGAFVLLTVAGLVLLVGSARIRSGNLQGSSMNVEDPVIVTPGGALPAEPSVSIPHEHQHIPVTSPPKYILSKDWVIDGKPQRREYEWTVTDAEFNPDGVFRPMMVINNQFPGPLIRANEEDTIVIHVKNRAANATSFHWHGLYQNGTAWHDGSVGISQCPIPPGSDFTYEFQVKGQYGTYWYHAHHGAQSSDGLVGPLVIHSLEEKALETLPYHTDQVVMVSDHYHNTTSELIMKYLASDAENAEPVPNGALINGRGKTDCSKHPGRKCDSASPHIGYSKFDLEHNKDHKLRFINVGAFAEFQIAIDEHNFAVVEVDGTPVTPRYYDRFTITSAQRYSIVISANRTGTDSWWLRAKMLSACFTDPPKDIDTEVRAIITTNPSNNGLPSSKELDPTVDLICKDMNTTELQPAKAVRAPEKADATFYLRANFEIGAWRLNRGVFNSSSWRPDIQRPTLHRVVDGLHEKNASFAQAIGFAAPFVNDVAFESKKELVIQSAGIQVIDLIVTNFDDGNHPLHLHGYKFFLMGQGHGYYDPMVHKADTTNPLRRDTASVEAYGWLWIRVIADNPGAWPFHCHVTWHTEVGLLMQLVTRTDLLDQMTIPRANRDLCTVPKLELAKGGTPEDQAFYGSIA